MFSIGNAPPKLTTNIYVCACWLVHYLHQDNSWQVNMLLRQTWISLCFSITIFSNLQVANIFCLMISAYYSSKCS